MTLDVQFKLNSNPNYIKYLREHSYWYKTLTRNPNMINNFIDEVKEAYKLRKVDKINNALSTIEMIQNILSTLK